MNRSRVSFRQVLAAVALCSVVSAIGIRAQTSTATEVRSGEVVYASGNDLVVRMQSGEIKHFNVPPNARFSIDGQQVPTSALKPGTKLTQTITTTEIPETVETVRTVTGTVWFASAPKTVILTLPDKTNKTYYVPSGTTFDVDGRKVGVGDLRKGDRISATLVSTSTTVRVNQTNVVRGQAPPPPPVAAAPPATPVLVGVLLIEAPPSAEPAPREPTQQLAQLPKTAGNTPLFGVLGVLALGCSVAFRMLRKRSA